MPFTLTLKRVCFDSMILSLKIIIIILVSLIILCQSESLLAEAAVISLSMKGQKLSGTIKKSTIGEVLKEISRLAKIKVSVSEARAKQPVSKIFKNQPLDRAIKEILVDNYTLSYKDIKTQDGTIVSEVSEVNAVSSTEDGDNLVYTPEAPKKNRLNIEDIKDEESRYTTLKEIQRKEQDIDPEVLKKIARDDNSPRVRRVALEELAERFDWKDAEFALSQAAKNDPDSDVQSFARTLLQGRKIERAWMYKK